VKGDYNMLDKTQILREAIRLDYEFSQIEYKNSPSNTHYMMRVSEGFMWDASSKDTDTLLSKIQTKGVYLSTLHDEKGVFAFTQIKPELPTYHLQGETTKYEVLRQGKDYALLHREIAEESNPAKIDDPTPFIVAWKFNGNKDGTCDWSQGHYCGSLEGAASLYVEKEGLNTGIADRVAAAKNKASSQGNKSDIDKAREHSI
jgi:hypothetical protein